MFEFFERGVDLVVMPSVKWNGLFFWIGDAEFISGFQQTNFFKIAVRLGAIKRIAPLAADECNSAACALVVGAANSRAQWQTFNAAEPRR